MKRFPSLLLACLGVAAGSASAQTAPAPWIVEVSAAAQAGAELPARLLPYAVEGVDADGIRRNQAVDVTDVLNRRLSGVTLSNAQGNPLQPDVQYHGFSASPLLGGAQGLSVYLDGVRINELFGDTVNWDLLPMEGLADMRLVAGANPVYGLNTLGGALVLRTKTGFDAPGTHVEAATGSFGRTTSTVETGGHGAAWAYYLMASHLHERGWRDASPSDATTFLAASSWRWSGGSADLKLSHGESSLTGNGAAPVEELALRRSAVFTAPDRTDNRGDSATFSATQAVGAHATLAATLYTRRIRTLSYNGDASDFDACDNDASTLCGDDGAPIHDQLGRPVDATYDAIANIGVRVQRSHGATLQLSDKTPLLGMANHLTLGVATLRGTVDYQSVLELAHMTFPSSLPYGALIVADSGLTVPDHALHVDVDNQADGAYVSDTLELTPRLALTAAARYNRSRTQLADRSGAHPDLDGDHRYHRLNPALGAAFQWTPAVNVFGGYSEATRVPTPVELSCADANAPCLLPNDFVADPDLKQVVAKSWEAGVRGSIGDGTLRWQAQLFRTRNANDILFQSTGGAQSNRGFYANVGTTRRQGVQLSLNGATDRVDWYANVTLLDATFQTAFDEISANHPAADPDTGVIRVARGDRIPGVPRIAFKAGADRTFGAAASLGADVVYNSGQYLRGDEANLLGPTASYAVVNLHARYRLGRHVTLLVHIDNLFDRRYASFGTLGDPGGVVAGATDPRFVSLGAPRAAAVGLSLDL